MVSVTWLIVGYDCPRQRHLVRFSSSSQGSGGRAHHQVPRSSVVFHGSRRFSRSCRFRNPAVSLGFPHYFSGSRPLSEFQGFPPNFWGSAHFRGLAEFFKVWLSPKAWQSPEVWLSPKVRPSPKVFPSPDSRSVCHPTPGLSVMCLWSVHHPTSVCPSPNFVLSVTRLWSVRHPTLVCPSPDFGLSVTQLWSVCHPPSVCPSPDLAPGRFRA